MHILISIGCAYIVDKHASICEASTAKQIEASQITDRHIAKKSMQMQESKRIVAQSAESIRSYALLPHILADNDTNPRTRIAVVEIIQINHANRLIIAINTNGKTQLRNLIYIGASRKNIIGKSRDRNGLSVATINPRRRVVFELVESLHIVELQSSQPDLTERKPRG